jgi:hypothetical protein
LVKGFKIEFVSQPSLVDRTEIKVSQQEERLLDMEIDKLIHMGVIKTSKHEAGEIISPIFTRPKADGTLRLILNLKRMNESVKYEHFKMEGIDNVMAMMKKDCFMASIDLKHAYYSLPVHKDYTKFLKFIWKGKLYAYCVLPNGLSSGPRYFTKLLKPLFAKLRAEGHMSVGFIDDVFLQGDSYEECKNNVEETKKLFEKMGFLIHPEKSEFKPKKNLTFLGFDWNSENM